MKGILLAACMLLFISGCQKKDTPVGAVNMTITSPRAGQVFHSGDTVYIKATADYSGELHGYEIKVVDTATGFTVYDETQHVHSDKFTVNDQWVNAVTANKGYKLTFIVYVDHTGDDAVKELTFSMVP